MSCSKTMSVASRSQYYSGFDPRQFSNCALWLDAADRDSVTFSSGSNVTIWKDKSGNARDASAIGVPTWGTGPTGRRGMVFNGTNNFTGSNTNTTVNLTAFMVMDMSSTAVNNARALSLAVSGQGDFGSNGWFSAIQRNESLQQIRSFRNFNSLSTVDISYNVPFIASVYVATPTHILYRNGNAGGTGSLASGSFNYTQYGIANYPDYIGVARMTGTVYEVLLYNQALSSNDRQSVEGYLAWKWGLNSALLSNHIYRRAPNVTHPFNPTDLGSNLALWLDAADATSALRSGANASNWLDKSGNNRHFQIFDEVTIVPYVTSTPRDAYMNFINPGPGGQAAEFDISDISGLAINRTFSIFVVERRTSSQSTNYFIAGNGSFSGNSNLHIGYRNNTTVTLAFYANDLDVTIPTYAANSNTRIWGFNYTGLSQEIYANGSILGSRANSQNLLASGTAIMGYNNIGFNNYLGEIREVVWCTPAVTTAQRQQVEGYLAWKWGRVADLSTTHPFKLYYPLASSFNPLVLSNCVLWLDAADQSTIALSGSSVTSVSDKSGGGITLTTQGTSSLLTLVNRINGRQTLYFNNSAGNSVYLQGTLSRLLTGSFFVVWQAATQLSTAFRPLYAWQSAGGLNFPVFGYTNVANTVAPYTTNIGAGTPTNTVSAGTNYLMFYSWTGTTTNVGVNGATPTAGTQSAYASTSSTFTVMAELGSTTLATTGYIGEMVFYSRVLTATERQAVEGYLAWKWGTTTTLPTAHPYKTTRP
jgi:hypothetical protein